MCFRCVLPSSSVYERKRAFCILLRLRYSPSRIVVGCVYRPRADPQKTVKEYSRPAAGRTDAIPTNIRPPSVLLHTVAYLFKHIVAREDGDWVQVYDFVFDRLRAVRQDAVVQCVDGENAIDLLEQIVRFHVYASYRLCEAPQDRFDPVINDQHLLECLKRLLRLYSTTPGHHANQPQFESVYLLHNLGSSESLLHGLSLPSPIRQAQVVQEALALNLAFIHGNFVRFFRLVSQLTCSLSLCSVHQHFQHVRLHALRVMSAAYSSKNCRYPVASLQRVLCEGRGELMELAHSCSLVDEDEVVNAQHISFQRSKFTAPTKMRVHHEGDIDKRLASLDIASWLLGQQSTSNDT